jgi:hypothetical protein
VLFLIFFKKWSTVSVGLEKHPIFKENLSHKRKKKYNAKENKSLKGHTTITALNSCLVTLCNHTTRP